MRTVTVCLIFLSSTVLLAQEKKEFKDIVLNDLINETQFNLDAADGGAVTLVWWLPTEFWKAVYANESSVDEETAKEITDALDKYTLVLGVDGEMSGMGNFKSKSESYIRNKLRVKGEDGEMYKAIDKEDVNFETQMFINILEPVIQNMLGQLGEGMHIMVFEKEGGGKVIDAYGSEGTISYNSESLELELPLSSLLIGKECPEDGELMDPKWNFCPTHGVKLD